jgi:hypothetical protein
MLLNRYSGIDAIAIDLDQILHYISTNQQKADLEGVENTIQVLTSPMGKHRQGCINSNQQIPSVKIADGILYYV